MKICWDNLEKIWYNQKTGKWRKGNCSYIYMDSCKNCGEPYLSVYNDVGECCSLSCSNIKKFNCNYSHGLSKTPTYKTWKEMKQRCYNSNNHKYKDYGGRGIFVCRRWRNSFENFLKDMGERPSKELSIDRIDNNGPYGPWNCRWATDTQQGRNRRFTKLNMDKAREIRKLLHEGKLTQKEIGRIFNISISIISSIKHNKIWKE